MTISRGILAKRRYWKPAEDVVVRLAYPYVPTVKIAAALGRRVGSVYQRAYGMGLEKSPEYLASPAACRTNGRQGIGTRFAKGHASWNKGTHWTAGGRSAETRFKKGGAPHNTVPIGTEVLDADRYLKRKVSDDRTKPSRYNWRFVHVIVWEEAHGPVPNGHAIVFKNADASDIRLDNLECISRRELMLRNTVHNLPKPLAETIQLLGALKRKIRNREEQHAGKKQDRRSAGSPVRDARSAEGRDEADGDRTRPRDRRRRASRDRFSEGRNRHAQGDGRTQGDWIHSGSGRHSTASQVDSREVVDASLTPAKRKREAVA